MLPDPVALAICFQVAEVGTCLPAYSLKRDAVLLVVSLALFWFWIFFF